MMATDSEAIEGPVTEVYELETWNGASNDDGAGNFRAESPGLDNVQWDFFPPCAADQEENVEAVPVADGSSQIDNDHLLLPSSTIPAGGFGTTTRCSDDQPQSDDSSSCSTPTDELQMATGILDMPCKQMMLYMRTLSHTDEDTLIKRHRGEYNNQKVKIMEYPEMHMRQFLKGREMAYLRDKYILPILGYSMRNRLVMYPAMVRGNLAKVCPELGWTERLRIMYQLSAGLAFLHTSVPGVREEIWHGNIKAENIYLDQYLNVRIGDFSEAIELRKKSASPADIAKDDARRRKCLKDDIYSLTRVGLLLLKSSDEMDYRPNVNKMMRREKYWDMKIWSHVHHQTRKEMVILIVRCSRRHITAERLEINLKGLLRSHHISLYNFSKDRGNYCIYCCVNTQDDNPVPVPTSDSCPIDCASRRFCRTCYQTSYRNILSCPDHGPLKNKIHKKDVYAILVSGSEQEPGEQSIMDGDVESMFNVVTDPKIMGFSAASVFKIRGNSENKRKEIFHILKILKTKTVHTLIWFYSGHGNKARADEDDGRDSDEDDGKESDEDDGKESDEDDDKESDEDDGTDSDEDEIPRFQLGTCIDASMTDKDLRKLLTPFTKSNVLVIMDCCYAKRYKVLPQHKDPQPNIWHIQFNGTGSSNFGWMDSKINSVFTCCLVRALEGGFGCPEGLCDTSKCKARVNLQESAAAAGYISLGHCHEYFEMHVKDYSVESADSNFVANGISGDLPIANYSGEPLGIFKFEIGGKRRRMKMYQLQDEPDDMLRQLWDCMGNVVSSRRRQLLKDLDFLRCLMMTVPGNKAELEIKTKFEVVRECRRGHTVQLRIRSRCEDLEPDRWVVCFFLSHTHFKEVLDMIKESFRDYFWDEFKAPPDDGIEIVHAAVIGIDIADDPDLPKLQLVYQQNYEKNYCKYNKYLDLILKCLTRAGEMARINSDIRGLRIHMTKTLATLELEMK